MALLDVRNLKTYFYLGRYVLKAINGVSFKLDRGKVLAIVGESGSGKSVTCRSIIGVQNPGKVVEGEVLFEGENLLELSYRKKREIRGNEISMIFQNPMTSLNPLISVGRQIEDQVLSHKSSSKKTVKKDILESFKLISIKNGNSLYDKYPCELSGSVIQQIMVAASIVCNPRLIIADEPTSNLDVIGQANIIKNFVNIKKRLGTAIILITHDLGVASQLADNIFVMYGGERVEYGPANEILTKPKNPYTKGLIKSVLEIDTPYTSKLSAIPGDPVDLFDPPLGCYFYPRCEESLEICKTKKPSLISVSKGHYCACFLYSSENLKLVEGENNVCK